jgi:hypothetical protein
MEQAGQLVHGPDEEKDVDGSNKTQTAISN